MFSRLFSRELLHNSEYQSAWVRLAIWGFSVGYIGLGAWTDYYAVDVGQYYLFFGFFILLFLGLLVSIYYVPEMPARRYVTVVSDIVAVSLAIFLTNEAISPFYLLYIWIFVSYGTRYGKRLLKVASILSVFAYNVVLIALDEWQQHTFEAFFFLLLLVVLPMYQYSLLRKLHEARQEAEQANKARGDFLATMTHELRTPLIGVIGMSRLMQTTRLDSEQQEYLHSIKASAHLLRALIGDILDFSKIDANKLELESSAFEIRELLRGVTSTLATEAQEKQVELICQVDARLPRELLGDELRLSQILFNLVGNAIKFTDEGEVILRVLLAPGDDMVTLPHVRLEVEDTGIGIPAEKLENIFEMFWQADVSTSRRFGGTGLGTTVARDLARLMGGDIGVRSRLGEGTCFWVKLPLLPKDGSKIGVKPPILSGRHCLLLEANDKGRVVYSEMVTELGMEVTAVSSVDSLAQIPKQAWELILLCDSVNGIDPESVLNQLDDYVTGQPPVLFAGYRGRKVDLPARATPVLLKPFLVDQLAQAAVRALRGESANGEDEAALPKRGGQRAEDSGVNILLAEDNSIAAKVLTTLLVQKGHRVIHAIDGRQALEAATSNEFHLAFIDLRMPHLDGFDFTRLYREQEPEGLHMPILALTANAAEDVIEQCHEAGMDGFINKPAEPQQLDLVISRYVQTQEYE
ncbi:hybrid sensor histidine kinase/response regulator [bacterium endosymbiont of Escarpia laminata]|nr:MAG: hybrid sensor histidine kinase/response regulator [bacterium endosymbiont of Escarpia laminata]